MSSFQLLDRPRIALRNGYEMWACPETHCTLRIATPNGEYVTHACPYLGGSVHYSDEVILLHMLDQLWRWCDEEYDRLVALKQAESPDSAAIEFSRGKLAGFCQAVAQFYAKNLGLQWAAGVVVSRAKIRAEGHNLFPEIPESRLHPKRDLSGSGKYPAQSAPRQGSPESLARTLGLSDTQVAKIKNSPFPVEDLAGIYKLTIAQIKSIQSSS